MPKRLQRMRTKGWKMPKDAIYVGRPTRWGNPYKVGEDLPLKMAVALYAQRLQRMSPQERRKLLEPLRGKHLVCWCRPESMCHADVLLKWANR